MHPPCNISSLPVVLAGLSGLLALSADASVIRFDTSTSRCAVSGLDPALVYTASCLADGKSRFEFTTSLNFSGQTIEVIGDRPLSIYTPGNIDFTGATVDAAANGRLGVAGGGNGGVAKAGGVGGRGGQGGLNGIGGVGGAGAPRPYPLGSGGDGGPGGDGVRGAAGLVGAAGAAGGAGSAGVSVGGGNTSGGAGGSPGSGRAGGQGGIAGSGGFAGRGGGASVDDGSDGIDGLRGFPGVNGLWGGLGGAGEKGAQDVSGNFISAGGGCLVTIILTGR